MIWYVGMSNANANTRSSKPVSKTTYKIALTRQHNLYLKYFPKLYILLNFVFQYNFDNPPRLFRQEHNSGYVQRNEFSLFFHFHTLFSITFPFIPVTRLVVIKQTFKLSPENNRLRTIYNVLTI